MIPYYVPEPPSEFNPWIFVLTIIFLIAVVVAFFYWNRKRRRRMALSLNLKHRYVPEIMKSLDPLTFELWVQGLFINIGADAVISKREPGTGFDHGIDLLVTFEKQKICVQCKKYFYKNLVDETKVRDLYGVLHGGKFDKAILVTTSSFTNRAIAWAENKKDLILINGQLLQKIRDNSQVLIKMLRS